MFSYENLFIYKQARSYNLIIRQLLKDSRLDYPTENQLRRAALSVVLNIAEGNGRFSKKDKRRFLIMSRSSVHECSAILDFLIEEKSINKETFNNLYKRSEELSKVLLKMINDLDIE